MSVEATTAPPWLSMLLSGFARRAMRVQAPSVTAPEPRAILTSHHLLMPVTMLGEDEHALARATIAHAAAHLHHSLAQQHSAGLKPMSVAVVSALEDARVERLAMAELPGLRRWWSPYHASEPNDGDLSFGAFVARLSRVLFDPSVPSSSHWIDKGRELFEREAAASLLDREAFRRIGSVLANDLGQMRVRFEPQAYRVMPVYRDDNTYLWSHAERPEQPPPDEQALQAAPELATLTLREVQASPDGGEPEQPQEIELGRYEVSEWDYRSARLKRDWCTVVDAVPLTPAQQLEGRGPRTRTLSRPVGARLNRARRLRRQLEGDEIDLDAAIDVMLDRRLGLEPDARLFRRPGREPARTSLLVLLDLSQSANDVLPGVGTSVLALEQHAALKLIDSVHGARDGPARMAVHGFNSNTREQVSYLRMLDFGAPFDASAAGRVIGARARHSTRIGAALRHATDLLLQETAATRRTLLVVTDGAPSDIDVFDPRYLVEDARAAVFDARSKGVQVHCLTLDAAGEPHARRIFGWQHFRVVANATALASHLRQVQTRAMAA